MSLQGGVAGAGMPAIPEMAAAGLLAGGGAGDSWPAGVKRKGNEAEQQQQRKQQQQQKQEGSSAHGQKELGGSGRHVSVGGGTGGCPSTLCLWDTLSGSSWCAQCQSAK